MRETEQHNMSQARRTVGEPHAREGINSMVIRQSAGGEVQYHSTTLTFKPGMEN